MRKEEFKNMIIQYVNSNDETGINLLATMLYEAEKAKSIMREKGYGWTGLSLLNTVIEELPIK